MLLEKKSDDMRECEILKKTYGPCRKDVREGREGRLCEKLTKLNNSYRRREREGFEKKKNECPSPPKIIVT